MTNHNDLRDRIAEALEAADYRAPMQRGDLADAVLPVVQAELDRLRAELERTRALANLRPCAYSGPHPCHLQGDGRSLYHCPGVPAPQE